MRYQAALHSENFPDSGEVLERLFDLFEITVLMKRRASLHCAPKVSATRGRKAQPASAQMVLERRVFCSAASSITSED